MYIKKYFLVLLTFFITNWCAAMQHQNKRPQVFCEEISNLLQQIRNNILNLSGQDLQDHNQIHLILEVLEHIPKLDTATFAHCWLSQAPFPNIIFQALAHKGIRLLNLRYNGIAIPSRNDGESYEDPEDEMWNRHEHPEWYWYDFTIQEAIEGMKNLSATLEDLDLTGNSLVNIRAEHWHQLEPIFSKLRRLNLAHNCLGMTHYLPFMSQSSWTALARALRSSSIQDLNLRYNDLGGHLETSSWNELINTFNNMRDLQTLNLSQNDLKERELNFLSNLDAPKLTLIIDEADDPDGVWSKKMGNKVRVHRYPRFNPNQHASE